MNLLVLDAHLSSRTLIAGVRGRAFEVTTLDDLGLDGRPDPDVMTQTAQLVSAPDGWVLVTMDLTILEDFPGFDWDRYAVAWVKVAPQLRGAAVEAAKHDIVHRHVPRIAEQRPADHFTYLRDRFYRHQPSLMSRAY
jgi:hypothetical protein